MNNTVIVDDGPFHGALVCSDGTAVNTLDDGLGGDNIANEVATVVGDAIGGTGIDEDWKGVRVVPQILMGLETS